jgi:cell division transport system permease protein
VTFRQFLYSIKKAFQNFKYFFVLNFITIGIISLSLLVLSTFLLVFLNLQNLLDKWKNQLQVTAYLADSLTPESLTLIKKKISRLPEVKNISFTSKEEALRFFKDKFPGQTNALEGLKKNPLPASIDIQLKDGYRNPDQIRNFANRIKVIPGVDEVEYGQSWIEGYSNFLSFLKSTGLAVGVVILLATVFIISNTIKLTVYARKEEIEIIKLVGGTNLFIKSPFFIEGIIQGLSGGLIALGILYICYRLFINWISQASYTLLQSMPISFLPSHYLILITWGGMLTGFLGSFFSLDRYLKT